MAHEMEKLVGTSEEEDDEEEGMELDVKEEEDQDEDGRIRAMVAEDVDMGAGGRYFLLPPELPPDAGDRSDTPTPSSASGSRRSRPAEEKERTKLRERHRRAITGRILSGLRRHGNYNLRVRADINEVIAALAREAGWIVLPDGTTLPPSQVLAFPLLSLVFCFRPFPFLFSLFQSKPANRENSRSGSFLLVALDLSHF